jgi:hypothetical protein
MAKVTVQLPREYRGQRSSIRKDEKQATGPRLSNQFKGRCTYIPFLSKLGWLYHGFADALKLEDHPAIELLERSRFPYRM